MWRGNGYLRVLVPAIWQSSPSPMRGGIKGGGGCKLSAWGLPPPLTPPRMGEGDIGIEFSPWPVQSPG